MNVALRIMCLLSALILLSCGGGGQSNDQARQREEARIQREVDQRVAEIRTEMKVSENRWNTARIVALCALAGCALLWLLNDKGGGNQPAIPEPRPRIPSERTRMIERPDPCEQNDEYDPYRR